MTLLIPKPLRSVTVTGENLFSLSAEYLDDATQWDRVARLNRDAIRPNWFYDPFLKGVQTVTLPKTDPKASNGGIFGQ